MGGLGSKDIVSGKPFLFYWVDDEIQIIKHRHDEIPFMRSDKEWLIDFGYGFEINADKNEKSSTYVADSYWVHP